MENSEQQTRYTAIYTDSRLIGSHRSTTTHALRFEQLPGESLQQAMQREDIWGRAVYVFEGWPVLEGDTRPVVAGDL